MNNHTHSYKFKKNVKKLKGFIKDDTIEKFMNINNKIAIKNSKYNLRYLMKIFLGLFAFFVIDYFNSLCYKKE
jgi:hypothetical protein